jgi:hypothetical protein
MSSYNELEISRTQLRVDTIKRKKQLKKENDCCNFSYFEIVIIIKVINLIETAAIYIHKTYTRVRAHSRIELFLQFIFVALI